MDDETLRIAIGLRLGCPLSLPHIMSLHVASHTSNRPLDHGMMDIPSGLLLSSRDTSLDGIFAETSDRWMMSFISRAVAAQAERKKIAKYSSPDSSYHFIPVAVETCGSFGPKTHELVSELGHRVRRATLEENSPILGAEDCNSSAMGECYFCPGISGQPEHSRPTSVLNSA